MSEALALAQLGGFEWDILNDRWRLTEEAYGIFGWEVGSEVTTERLRDCFTDEDVGRFIAARRALRPAMAKAAIDVTLSCSDRVNRRIQVRAKGAFDQAGTPIRVFGTIQESPEPRDAVRIERNAGALREEESRHQKAILDLAALDKTCFAPALEKIVRTSADTLQVERVSFWSFQGEDLQCELLYRRSRDVWEFGAILCAMDHPRYFEALHAAPVIAATDVHRDSRTSEFSESYFSALGIGAMLDVPVWHAGRLVGVVRHEHVGSGRSWSKAEVIFATSIGHMVSLAIADNERQQAERALRESEERFRVTFEEAPVGIGHTDAAGRWLWVNQRLCSLLNFTMEELVGRSWMDFIHPDDAKHSSHVVKRLMAGELQRASIEQRFLRPNGSAVWAHTSTSVKRNMYGTAEYLISVIQEITDRKRVEERVIEQANLLDLTQDAIIVRDLDDGIVFWNKGAEKLYGVSESAAIGQKESAMLYGDTWDFDCAKAAVLERGEWHGELRQSAPGQKTVIVDARWTLVNDEFGVAKSILSINTDITQRKALEEQFLRAQRLESIGTLASGVAHDLNNILAPILMAVPMLRGDLPEDLRDSLVSTVETSAQRGADIVRQVLTFARGVEGERALLQPYDLLRDMEKIASETFPKTLVVRNRAPRDLWPVNGDATQLHQVLMNLCVNARDAMTDGGMMTLEAENFNMDESYVAMVPEAQVGEYVMLKVSDTGTGIPREILGKIFDPFFTTKATGKGTGLGLSTSLGIVRSHGGFIKVESEPGRGTTFQVFLPATTEGLLDQSVSRPTNLPRGNGELILIVDDEAGVREVTKTVLVRQGYEVIVAADGTEALAAFAKHLDKVSLVVTDVVMPHIDGVALTRALRKLNPDLRVVAATGHTQNHRAAELRSLEVKGFLNKPFTAEMLLKVVNKALRK
jgi:PAS domain S-box-containing protein